MTETIAAIILFIVAAYLSFGFVFAIAFVISGVNKIDEGAHGSSIGFRIIIIPGVIIFWPVLLKKWIQHSKQKEETPQYSFAIKPLRKKHFRVWQILALFLPLIIIAAVAVRPEFPKSKLLQPATTAALPVVLKNFYSRGPYECVLRTNVDTSELQLEWDNKYVLTYPTAVIYQVPLNDTNIQHGKLIGRIEARGNYYFNLAKDKTTIQQYYNSTIEFVLYDFIHQKIIDTIKL